MTQSEVALMFMQAEVLLEGHFVFASGRHGDTYINKDALYPYVCRTMYLAQALAEHNWPLPIDAVIGPEKGGIILAHDVAYCLNFTTNHKTHAVYVEKELIPLCSADSCVGIKIQYEKLFLDGIKTQSFELCVGQSLLKETGKFIIKRGYEKFLKGKNVLVVEDILTTGSTIKKVIEAVRNVGGNVISVGALCNRGGVTAAALGVQELFSLAVMPLQSWAPEECPLCKENIPVRMDVEKGSQVLSQK